jgi:hypothetical protein
MMMVVNANWPTMIKMITIVSVPWPRPSWRQNIQWSHEADEYMRNAIMDSNAPRVDCMCQPLILHVLLASSYNLI